MHIICTAYPVCLAHVYIMHTPDDAVDDVHHMHLAPCHVCDIYSGSTPLRGRGVGSLFCIGVPWGSRTSNHCPQCQQTSLCPLFSSVHVCSCCQCASSGGCCLPTRYMSMSLVVCAIAITVTVHYCCHCFLWAINSLCHCPFSDYHGSRFTYTPTFTRSIQSCTFPGECWCARSQCYSFVGRSFETRGCDWLCGFWPVAAPLSTMQWESAGGCEDLASALIFTAWWLCCWHVVWVRSTASLEHWSQYQTWRSWTSNVAGFATVFQTTQGSSAL